MSALSPCSLESSFLSSWPYVVYPLQYSNIFFIPMSILAGYCILVKTPKAMQPMKYAYFNLHFWWVKLKILKRSEGVKDSEFASRISSQCIYFSLLVTPVLRLPTISATFLGLLSAIGVSDVSQGYIGFSSWIISMSATVTLFENRHQQIQRNRFRLSSPFLRFVIQAFNYLYSILYPFPVFLDIPDQLTAKKAFLDIVPCPYEDFFTLPLYTFSTDLLVLIYCALSMMAGLLITVTQIIFYSSTCLYYLVFNKYTGSSKMTLDRQKRFFLGILVQVSIPYSLLSPAIIYASWSMLTGYYSQKLNNVVVVAMGLYGTVATSALLIIHSPYRDFIRKLVGFSKENSAQPSAIRDQRGVGFASV